MMGGEGTFHHGPLTGEDRLRTGCKHPEERCMGSLAKGLEVTVPQGRRKFLETEILIVNHQKEKDVKNQAGEPGCVSRGLELWKDARDGKAGKGLAKREHKIQSDDCSEGTGPGAQWPVCHCTLLAQTRLLKPGAKAAQSVAYRGYLAFLMKSSLGPAEL